jgi:hypothetical protein
MRATVRLVALAILAAAAQVFAASAASAQPVEDVLDHFRCYEVLQWATQPPLWNAVRLTDQYETEDVQIGRPRLFCNPVDKDHPPVFWDIVDPRDHLTCYEVFGNVLTSRKNKIVNQFETKTKTMKDPELLCLPTEKNGEGFPANLDHFKCYETTPGTPLNVTVGLRDQFGASGAIVFDRLRMCNPTQKETPDGVIVPILHPEAHLMCYRLEDPIVPPIPDIGIRHQLYPDGSFLVLGHAQELCVPSLKKPAPICGLGAELLLLAPLLALSRRWRR